MNIFIASKLVNYFKNLKAIYSDFFVDYAYPQVANYRSDELQFAGVSFENLLNGFHGKRISDVAAFLGERKPELETLSDEMILSILGIVFSRP